MSAKTQRIAKMNFGPIKAIYDLCNINNQPNTTT